MGLALDSLVLPECRQARPVDNIKLYEYFRGVSCEQEELSTLASGRRTAMVMSNLPDDSLTPLISNVFLYTICLYEWVWRVRAPLVRPCSTQTGWNLAIF